MATLVFDIETTGQPVENYDEVQREYLFREAEKLPDEAERTKKREDIQRFFSLWPLTGQVVCIAMLNAESMRGKVLFVAEDYDEESTGSVEFVPCVDESEMLVQFWELAKRYDTVVTFNGRAFDVPFLYLRSAVLDVPVSRKDWLGYRFATEPHCDLAEQLCFYGVSGRDGAARKFNLDFYCKAFGIPSPKAQGVSGYQVPEMIEQGRFKEIAEYCVRDVEATVHLHRIWSERLKGIK
jgi:3'-5' exonuclease